MKKIIILLIVIGVGVMGIYGYKMIVKKEIQGKEVVEKKKLYRCPMHPNYTSDKPGDCPICNMKLVPVEEESEHSKHEGMKMEEKKEGRKILYWQDPMHPQYKSDKPGKAPDCGMDLVPVYEEEKVSEEMPVGTVKISPEKQQLIGVKFGEAKYMHLTKTLRTVARLTYDETKIAQIHTKIDGWVDKVFIDFEGKYVKKGEPLISVYSPELVSTQEEFLLAEKAKKYLGDSSVETIAKGAESLYETTKKRLLLWDITEQQIEEIRKKGEPIKNLIIYSPITGFVIKRNVYEKQRITPDTELYMIADLSTIWALADIYEYEIPMVKLNQEALLELPYFPGEKFKGRLTYIYPELDPTTRTLKVRLEFKNSDFKLKPDMYANVEIKIDYGEQLTVPEEALLDSGDRKYVFVYRGDGYFEPREVKIGLKIDEYYSILEGLSAGEKIVTSGNFLIDSESQLKAAISSMAGHKM